MPAVTARWCSGGWHIPSWRDFVIVVIHGGYQNRIDYNVGTLGLTHDLVRRGYDLFLFDLRGRGESEGKGIALTDIESDTVSYTHLTLPTKA